MVLCRPHLDDGRGGRGCLGIAAMGFRICAALLFLPLTPPLPPVVWDSGFAPPAFGLRRRRGLSGLGSCYGIQDLRRPHLDDGAAAAASVAAMGFRICAARIWTRGRRGRGEGLLK